MNLILKMLGYKKCKCGGCFAASNWIENYGRCRACFLSSPGCAEKTGNTVDPYDFDLADEYMKWVNSIPLEDLQVEGIEITDKVRDQWRMVGQCNHHFIQRLIEWDDEGLTPVESIWEKE